MDNIEENSARHHGVKLQDLQGPVKKFYEKLILWRDESQREFLEIIDTHSNSINEAMNSLVEEVTDLQAQLSVTTKERNNLIETVKSMSETIPRQPDNEDSLVDMGNLETEENVLRGTTTDNKEKESANNAIPNQLQHTLNVGNTEKCSPSDISHVNDTDMKHEGDSQNNIAQADEKTENIGIRQQIDTNELLAQSGINLPHYKFKEQSEANSLNAEIRTSAGFPFFAMKQEKNTEGKIMENRVKYDSTKKFKCDHCPYSSDHRNHLQKHISVVHKKVEKKFRCGQCTYASHTNYHLNEHISAKHDKIMSHACDYCNYVATCKGTLRKHKKHAHNTSGEKKFRCKGCPFTSVHSDALEEHLRKEHFPLFHKEKFDCDLCPTTCNGPEGLEYHVKKVHQKI